MNVRQIAGRLPILSVIVCCAIAESGAESWRDLVEADWLRQDENRMREIREPGLVRFVEMQLQWGGVESLGNALVVPRRPAPAVDGGLGEATWQNPLSIPAKAIGDPEYKLCHDGQWLYLAVSLPTQSESRFMGGPTAADAAGAVDGVKNGSYAFHTNWELSPWWQVDLGRPQPVGRIVVYNRLDYAPGLHYADTLTILVSDDEQNWRLVYENKGKHFDGVSGVGPLGVEFKDLKARFVRLQQSTPSGLFMHLDEVEVYSAERANENLALHRPAKQSSLSIWSKGGLLGSVLCDFGGRTVGFAGNAGKDGEPGIAISQRPTGPGTCSHGVQRRDGITTVEVALLLHDDRGTFPGQITVAGGQVLPLRLAADWQLVWPEDERPGFGRNRLRLDLRAPGPLNPPVEVAVETTVFTPRRPERGASALRRFVQPGTATVEFETACEGAAAVVLSAKQGAFTWREARTVFIPPVRETLERGARLLHDFEMLALSASLKSQIANPKSQIQELSARAEALAGRERTTGTESTNRLALLREVRWAVRDLALMNPLLNFDKLLFVKRFAQQTYPDVCLNHMPWTSRPGGDLCILSPVRPEGDVRPLLNGALGPGHVHGMDLWWDGSRVVFAYAKARSQEPPAGWLDRARSYDLRRSEEPIHLFEIGIDGLGLRQITEGEWSDLDPTYLPNGNIAFVSERCGYSLQCNEYDKDETSCNLYVVRPDGTGLHRLSVTKDGDYLPHALDNGLIAYTRWEYHERNWANIQSIWTIRPDGTQADALFKQHFNDPWGLEETRSIPGSKRLVAIATGHHTLPVGPVVVVDPSVGINNPKGIRIVTPGVLSPEGGMSGTPVEEGGVLGRGGGYMHPWPLSEKHFLVSYAYGGMTDERGYALYLIDVYGTKELVYRDPNISCFVPIPLRPRPRPPVLTDATYPDRHQDAVCVVTKINDGVRGLGPDQKIRYLRIAEPVGWPYDNQHGGQRFEPDVKSVMVNWNPTRVLGTVPVEEDGSAHFRVPPDTAVYFQALDENQMELIRMRSFVSFQPGEVRSCAGCHETRARAARGSLNLTPTAVRRPPSVPAPPPWGDKPISFLRDVQPVFDRHCVSCHSGLKPAGALDFSGGLTAKYNRAYDTINAARLVSRSNVGDDAKITTPLMFGSHKSKLIEAVRGSHRDRVKLNEEDRLRLITWVDANAPYHGAFINKRGERPLYDPVADRENLDKIAAIHTRRCASCHQPADVTRSDWIDLRAPERSRFLAAPLANAAGSTVRCQKTVYADTTDPDYDAVRATVEAIVRKAWDSPRRDVATLDRPQWIVKRVG